MTSVFHRLRYYWEHTARDLEWKIAYRKRPGGSILQSDSTPFTIFEPGGKNWAADPFLFIYKNDMYLFMELYLRSSQKGVIACSKYDKGIFEKPVVVLEEPFHLSFPCIFEMNNHIYMIPETSSQRKICLYECDQFPGEWHLKKVVAEGLVPSDIIVYEHNGEHYAIVSVLTDSASKATNRLYRIDGESLDFVECGVISKDSEKGIRNAGLLFEADGRKYRPGQNGENGSYGKSLYFWTANICDNQYSEDFVKEVCITDVEKNIAYSGIHTYNCNEKCEVVDYRIIIKKTILRRVIKILVIICEYSIGKIKQSVKMCSKRRV